LLYQYKSLNTDAEAAFAADAQPDRDALTYFTCVTGTKVQMLTQKPRSLQTRSLTATLLQMYWRPFLLCGLMQARMLAYVDVC
jgi:hypothetical protein